jgi:hypothetical protein
MPSNKRTPTTSHRRASSNTDPTPTSTPAHHTTPPTLYFTACPPLPVPPQELSVSPTLVGRLPRAGTQHGGPPTKPSHAGSPTDPAPESASAQHIPRFVLSLPYAYASQIASVKGDAPSKLSRAVTIRIHPAPLESSGGSPLTDVIPLGASARTYAENNRP